MNKFIETNWLTLVAIAMIMISMVATLPYAYFQLMDWVVAGAALMVAMRAKTMKRAVYKWLFILAAVVFNPIAPVVLSASQTFYAEVIVIVMFAVAMLVGKNK